MMYLPLAGMVLNCSLARNTSKYLVKSPVGSHLDDNLAHSSGYSFFNLFIILTAVFFWRSVHRMHFVLNASGRSPAKLLRLFTAVLRLLFARLSSTTQHAMSLEFRWKWETESVLMGKEWKVGSQVPSGCLCNVRDAAWSYKKYLHWISNLLSVVW